MIRSLRPTPAALLLGILLVACSSAPKAPDEVFDTRKRAADWLNLADSLVAQGQYDSAGKYYRQAVDAYASVDALEGVSVSHHSMGRLFLLSGELALAKEEFGQAVDYARLSGSPFALSLAASGLGEALLRLGDREGALANFEEAVSSAGKDAKVLAIALHDRAGARYGGGDVEGAKADLAKATELNKGLKRWPELAANAFLLAKFLEKEGDLDGAIASAKEALAWDKKAENAAGVAGDLLLLAGLSKAAGKADDEYWYWRRAFDSALGANLARQSEQALEGLIAACESQGKKEEIGRWSALLAKLRSISH